MIKDRNITMIYALFVAVVLASCVHLLAGCAYYTVDSEGRAQGPNLLSPQFRAEVKDHPIKAAAKVTAGGLLAGVGLAAGEAAWSKWISKDSHDTKTINVQGDYIEGDGNSVDRSTGHNSTETK